jgi:RND family efflux transporter MFP subunit
MIKIKKKKIVIAVIIVLFVFFVLSKTVFKNEQVGYTKEEVKAGTIVQEVSETGAVKKGEEISLSFQAGGKIEKTYVAAGQEVKAGSILAKLDSVQLSIKHTEAQASLDVAKAQLQVAQTSVANYQNTLSAENQNLTDVSATAQENLDNAYEDALNELDSAYLKIYNALDTVKIVQTNYFNGGDQEGVAVSNNKIIIENSLNALRSVISSAKASSVKTVTDSALSVAKKSLEDTFSALTIIRQTCDVSFYGDMVSSAYKTSLDTHRTNINITLSSVIGSQQTISSVKIANEANINTAKNRVTAAEGNLKKSQDDISLYQAQLKQTEASLNLLQRQINDASIFAPADGQVTDVLKKTGEIAQASEAVVSFISSGPFQIEADIYEEDVVKVKVGDPVAIKLPAFSYQNFSGKVLSISPAEKLLDGVVYYEVKIDFPEAPQETRVGMTADIIIKTAQKDNALIVSESAITKRDNKNFVQVVKDEIQEEREVQVGIKGSEGQVEITSGLQAGEFVAITQ